MAGKRIQCGRCLAIFEMPAAPKQPGAPAAGLGITWSVEPCPSPLAVPPTIPVPEPALKIFEPSPVPPRSGVLSPLHPGQRVCGRRHEAMTTAQCVLLGVGGMLAAIGLICLLSVFPAVEMRDSAAAVLIMLLGMVGACLVLASLWRHKLTQRPNLADAVKRDLKALARKIKEASQFAEQPAKGYAAFSVKVNGFTRDLRALLKRVEDAVDDGEP